MDEHHGSTSDRIWIGLCILLLVATVGVGAFGYMRQRQARRAEAQKQAEEQAAVERSAELSAKIQAQQQRIEQLDAKNEALRKQSRALRQQLERTGK